MKVVCAWCKSELGSKAEDSDALGGYAVSHGLCDTCARHLMAQAGMPLEQYLNGLEAPVAVVGPTGLVQTANAKARAMLGKEIGQISGLPGGDVFECEYALLPEGCGNTVHCTACTIRNTVMDSFQTGVTHVHVSARLNQMTPSGPQVVALSISTERVGDVVLLRIDQIG